MRIALGIAGAGLATWGGWLLLPELSLNLLFWLGGGVAVHDFVIAPLVGATGLLVKRASIGVGLTLTAVLALLAVPLVWRTYSGPVNPGLHDRDYPLGLAAALAVVWTGVALYEVAAHLQQRRRTNENHHVADQEQ